MYITDDIIYAGVNDHQVDLFEEADRLEKDSQELRLNPVVNDFLAVEQDVCSMLREVTGRISDEVQIRLPEL